jgi:hypothetical protein
VIEKPAILPAALRTVSHRPYGSVNFVPVQISIHIVRVGAHRQIGRPCGFDRRPVLGEHTSTFHTPRR